MAHSASASPRSEDPTSVIVVDAVPSRGGLADFFSFDSPGEFTLWAKVVLGVLACCAFASMITIHTKSSNREPPAVMALLRSQQCPLLSTQLPPLAYEGWLSTCATVASGHAYACATQGDCVSLGSRCAAPALLAQLQCVDAGVLGGKKVCALPSANTTASAAVTPGFCTAAGTTCAVCLSGSCAATTPSAGAVGCPSSSACSDGSWWCLMKSAV